VQKELIIEIYTIRSAANLLNGTNLSQQEGERERDSESAQNWVNEKKTNKNQSYPKDGSRQIVWKSNKKQ